ncbi:hypothetical protein ACFX2J_027414 [Malus domestica]
MASRHEVKVRIRTKTRTEKKHDMKYSCFRRSGGNLTALHNEALLFGDGANEREGCCAIVICFGSSLIILLRSLAVFTPHAGVECNPCIWMVHHFLVTRDPAPTTAADGYSRAILGKQSGKEVFLEKKKTEYFKRLCWECTLGGEEQLGILPGLPCYGR